MNHTSKSGQITKTGHTEDREKAQQQFCLTLHSDQKAHRGNIPEPCSELTSNIRDLLTSKIQRRENTINIKSQQKTILRISQGTRKWCPELGQYWVSLCVPPLLVVFHYQIQLLVYRISSALADKISIRIWVGRPINMFMSINALMYIYVYIYINIYIY